VSRTRLSALSILLRNRKRGIFRSSSSRRINCSCGNLLLVGLAHNHGRIDEGQHGTHVVDELDRSRAIDEGVALPHERGGRHRQLDAHAVVARFPAGVAHSGAGLDRTLALDRTSAKQDRFEQTGLATLERAQQRNAAWTCGARIVLCHDCLPALSETFNPSFQAEGGDWQEAAASHGRNMGRT